jgi:hypothetical protein
MINQIINYTNKTANVNAILIELYSNEHYA